MTGRGRRGRVVPGVLVAAVVLVVSSPRAGADAGGLGDYLFTGHVPHPAVARIVTADDVGTSVGSGVLVDANPSQGLVLTNWHVIRDSRGPVLVQFADGFQSAATVLRYDADWDLAAMVIWKPPAQPVALAPAAPVVGDRLTIAGYGRGVYREESGACTGYLSPGGGLPNEFVELAATARQGDSGGPILDAERRLAGVLFGQNDGRTIGSCSSRVRVFLASVGSWGFTPPPAAGPTTVALAAPTGAPPVPAPVGPQSPTPAAGGEHVVRSLADLLRHREVILSGAGGLALVVLGLRALGRGRRR